MEALAELGTPISIDDFGTGQSSLAQLKDLPADEVKLDRGCVARLTSDPRDQAIVEAVVEMARRLGLRTVAEGVEDRAAWELLARLGTDVGQGFGIARPMPARELDAFLGAPHVLAA